MTRIPAGRRTKWLVLALWLAVLAVCGPVSEGMQRARHDDVLSYLPRDAQSTQAYRLARGYGDADLTPAVVTYERVGGLTAADRSRVGEDAATWGSAGGGVGGITGGAATEFSADGRAARFAVAFDGNDPRLAERVRRLRTALEPTSGGGAGAGAAAAAGLRVHVGGPAGQSADSYGFFDAIDGPLLYLTLGVVMVLLLLTYRSPVLWIVPLVAAFAGLTVAQAAAVALAGGAGLTINGLSQGIMLVLTVGAGVDYALLLVSRYREELTRYRDKHDAMAVALRNAGPAIVASAGTVAVSLLCLLLSVLNSDRGLGPVAALGVLGAFAAMTTLLPALLVALPRHTFWPMVPHYDPSPRGHESAWGRIAGAVARRPRATWVAATVLLLGMAAGLGGLRSSGLSGGDAFSTRPDSVLAERVAAAHFGGDQGDVAVVIGAAPAAERIRAAVAADPGVVPIDYAPRFLGTYVRFDVELVGPPDSRQAQAAVRRLRDAVGAVPGAAARVGGLAAIGLDVLNASRHDRNVVIPAVLVVVLLVLFALLRSVVAPVVLMGTVVVSFAAALGASWLVFREVFGFHGTDVGYPLFSFVFLVALGIDYNIFLMTRIQEEARRHGTRAGTIRGVAATGGVITSAGVVLAATFAVLTTLPLVALIEIGFTVAFGVLLDTLLVRSVLVPALVVDAGERIWWPGTA